MKNPLVAIVGRPNVGKSTLFNRLVGYRRAIVYDRPGVTRDRNIVTLTINDRIIDLMDTGGFEFETKDKMNQLVNDQIQKGIEDASLLMIVFDGKHGVTDADDRMVRKLRTFGKPILVVINKVDTKVSDTVANEFYKYVFKEVSQVSAEHGIGIEDLKDTILEKLGNQKGEVADVANPPIKIAFVGRPNVGKSSIVNALIDEERLAVSEIAGTTRDTIDISFEKNGQKFILLDTAGMRYKRKVDDDVEYFSIKRTFEAIEQADIVFLVVASNEQLTTQDQKIASKVIERRKGFCILANKWDLADKGDKVKETFRKELYSFSSFLSFSDVVFISAKTKYALDNILKMAKQIMNRLTKEYEVDDLIHAYQTISKYHNETGDAGYHLQLKGLHVTPGKGRGPIFRIKCNKPHRVSETYHRYWQNALVDFFQLRNVPIKVIFAKEAKKKLEKEEKLEPIDLED
ncbi:MAG: ribosome biogenesis GTPase Der [Proteobacteria bacterium]|nr:ribosome biogenesis GTPase Der [Pseudomonadota bacterium]